MSLQWGRPHPAAPRPSLLSSGDREAAGQHHTSQHAPCCRFPCSAGPGWRRAGPHGFAAGATAAAPLWVQPGPLTELPLPEEPTSRSPQGQTRQGAGVPAPVTPRLWRSSPCCWGSQLRAKGQRGGKVNRGIHSLAAEERHWKTCGKCTSIGVFYSAPKLVREAHS